MCLRRCWRASRRWREWSAWNHGYDALSVATAERASVLSGQAPRGLSHQRDCCCPCVATVRSPTWTHRSSRLERVPSRSAQGQGTSRQRTEAAWHRGVAKLIARVDGASSPDMMEDQIHHIRFDGSRRMLAVPISRLFSRGSGLEPVWERSRPICHNVRMTTAGTRWGPGYSPGMARCRIYRLDPAGQITRRTRWTG